MIERVRSAVPPVSGLRPTGRSHGGIPSGWSTTPPPLLPPRVQRDGTHRRLLEAALIRFGEQGYHGVSIRELAEDAGITKSSVYAHITAKEELLTELMLLGHEEHHDVLRDALLTSGPEPVAQVSALVRAHVTLHASYPLLARVANKELHALSGENAQRVIAVRLSSTQYFLDVIERGTKQGVFHVDNPWLATAAIGAMGIRVAEWYTPESGFTVDELARSYTEFALRILTRG